MSTLVPVDHDIESTDTEIIEQNITGTTTSTPTDQGNSNSTRNHWRQILLLFRVCLHLKYSIINNGATNISATDPAYAELPSYEALFDHDGINSEDNNITTTDNNNNNSTTPELTVPFATSSINKDTLIRILKEMNLITLRDHGGVEGLAASLATDLENGISTEVEVLQRRQVEYGTNTYCPESIDPPKNFVHFLLRACKDWTIILLLCCAAISLASGLKEEGQENGWYDGTTLFIIVFVLVSATSFRNYISSCRSQELKINKNLLVINVLRQGLLQEVVVCDIVVGDLVFLSAGDWIPSDGLFVNGNDLKVEDGVWHHELTIIDDQNPFLYYGAKVIYGSGHMLVTSVGMNTTMGNMMSKVIHDVNRKGSPLQFQIDKINTYLQNVGLFLGVLILLVLLVRYFRGKIDDETGYPDQISNRTASEVLMKAVERFVTKPRGIFASLTNVFAVLLVGLHEGLPLLISLSLSYWNHRMSKDHQVTICEPFGATTLGSMTCFVINNAALRVDFSCVGEETISENSVPMLSSDETRTAVNSLQNAGVSIKLVSAESLAVVKPIAVEYGIFLPDQQDYSNGTVLEGEVFRNFSDPERMEIADKITVMGSASPLDRLLLVQSLRQKGQVVAVMGTKTAELPALKEADLALYMGTNNSEMTRESCDIIISNNNFASIVDVLLIGRSNYQNIRRFLQLELTTNISGILITFVATVSSGDTPITPFQFFLVSLTIGTVGALALLTEPPIQDVLEMSPINQTQPIISKSMRRNIFVQVCYQGIALLILQFIKGQDFLGLMDPKVKKAMTFNGFVLSHIFNQFNARQPEKKNVFRGIIGRYWFLVSAGVAIILEVLLMEFAERVTGFPRLNKMQWLVCISFAIMSWPIDYAVKCISACFANWYVGSPSRLNSTGPLQSTPFTSPSQLPIPLMNV